MNKDQVLKALLKLQESDDPEASHVMADWLLLQLIDDDEVKDAFMALKRYYA